MSRGGRPGRYQASYTAASGPADTERARAAAIEALRGLAAVGREEEGSSGETEASAPDPADRRGQVVRPLLAAESRRAEAGREAPAMDDEQAQDGDDDGGGSGALDAEGAA